MNASLSTFMKVAITAIVIGSLIFGGLYSVMGGFSEDVNNYIEGNNAN